MFLKCSSFVLLYKFILWWVSRDQLNAIVFGSWHLNLSLLRVMGLRKGRAARAAKADAVSGGSEESSPLSHEDVRAATAAAVAARAASTAADVAARAVADAVRHQGCFFDRWRAGGWVGSSVGFGRLSKLSKFFVLS